MADFQALVVTLHQGQAVAVVLPSGRAGIGGAEAVEPGAAASADDVGDALDGVEALESMIVPGEDHVGAPSDHRPLQ